MRRWSALGMEKMMKLDLGQPVTYRWSGRFVAKDDQWSHMERQLVDYELIVMEKGTLYVEDEWERYEVREGQYLFMEPTKQQRGWKKSKCKFYWMHFYTKAVKAESKPLILEIPKQGDLKNPERLYVLMKQLQDADLRYMDPAGSGYFATTILFELRNQIQPSFAAAIEKQADDLRERVDDYLYRHLSEVLTVGMLAKEFGYHEKYFSTLFKEKTGRSVKQYVDERKVDRAKYLLLNTDAWVAEIAEHLGYADVQNFYHLFKKATNCTPSEYRNLYQKKQDYHV